MIDSEAASIRRPRHVTEDVVIPYPLRRSIRTGLVASTAETRCGCLGFPARSTTRSLTV